MKRIIHKHLLVLLGASLLGLSGIASAGIVSTKHNLGSSAAATNNKVTDTADTCVFCHTPHKGAGGTVPLWNKNIGVGTAADGTALTPYSSTTMDGTVNYSGSTSMACLSCHDGTQAMDNIINAPGSGGFVSGGTDLTYTWSTATNRVDANGKMLNDAAGSLSMLGKDLSDDHPVAIPYGGGGVTTGTPSGATTDPDFTQVGATANSGSLTLTTAGGKWWFEDSGANGRIDSTEIRLYTVGTAAQVECASCHDPHSSAQATFLRMANTNSAVCTACHTK